MKVVKNILIGFAVSFIGSIPLGYLNLVGYHIYTQTNLLSLMYYLLGVICMEVLVVYGTLQFANQFNLNARWKSRVSLFSIFFLFFMAYYFYFTDVKVAGNIEMNTILFRLPTFLVGLLLSIINFAQLPFWMSWNLLLINGNYIATDNHRKWFYIIGTLMGTFCGMFVFISCLTRITGLGLVDHNAFSDSIPLLFIGLALFQVYKLLIESRKISNG